ncbi:hypothetical protein [Comamonas aquatica]|uniref:Arsenical-resistance protein n=1 Tax=Comamonas aquatica TaxID=225991 RepID=A0AA42HVP6_9BURK|nr:hypothetical protein [Comamonas aquatica]MDH0365141.1 hypothetical protein [Comamonas aquatica]
MQAAANAKPVMGWFERYLTLWVLLCIGAGMDRYVNAPTANY